jgi:D-alanyl-D-alanine carboxypeptidase/D-alanyl-D-alanine-endopeptidase (penicillin-binding protein 4)
MTAVPDGDALRVTVRGKVKAGAAARDWVRVLDPVRFVAETFRAELERAGIKVGPRIARGHAGDAPVLVKHLSRPLSEIVQVMNLNSNNFYAEQLLKATGAKALGAPGSTAKGLRTAGQLLTRSGARAGSFRLANGSGLMGGTAVAPIHLVKLLERLHSLPWLEKAVRESLPVAGLNGTLAKRLGGTVAAGRVRAKTGTIHGVSCLMGYVDGPSGKPPILFAILHNGFTSSHGAVRKVQDRIVTLLARYAQSR